MSHRRDPIRPRSATSPVGSWGASTRPPIELGCRPRTNSPLDSRAPMPGRPFPNIYPRCASRIGGILPRSFQRPRASTEGRAREKINKTGVRLWTIALFVLGGSSKAGRLGDGRTSPAVNLRPLFLSTRVSYQRSSDRPRIRSRGNSSLSASSSRAITRSRSSTPVEIGTPRPRDVSLRSVDEADTTSRANQSG
jgi:hypothetical protein